jgi:glycosyltransferase involved in cell wall biosynthesis
VIIEDNICFKGKIPELIDKYINQLNEIYGEWDILFDCDWTNYRERPVKPELLVYPKKPLQCIYTSSPDRGLDVMIKIILKAVKTLPTITLIIYANEELIHPESMQRIRSHPERFTLLPRTNSKELHRSFAESDYWIYPTSFTETYCITALEAQYYQCVCITTGVGSLSEIVGQRGILLTEKADSDDIIGETVKKIEFMERNPSLKDMYRTKGHEWAEKQVMKEIGKKWEQLIQY